MAIGRRDFINISAGAIGAYLSGCSGKADPTEARAKKYFADLYNIDRTSVDCVIEDATGVPQELKGITDFVHKLYPQIDLQNPSQRDAVFLKENSMMIQFYQEYTSIDVHNLTGEQRWMLNHFDSSAVEEEDRKLIPYFAWIDPNNLTDRDKVFLENVREGVAEAVIRYVSQQ